MMLFALFCTFAGLMAVRSQAFFPMVKPAGIKYFQGKSSSLFRSLLLDHTGDYILVGGQNAVYKLRLDDGLTQHKRSTLPSLRSLKPNFYDRSTERRWWTTVRGDDENFQRYPTIQRFIDKYDPSPNINTYHSLSLHDRLNDFLRDFTFGDVTDLEGNGFLETAQQYATIYQAANLTFSEHCKRQADVLSKYYGNNLQMAVNRPESLCDTHIRGMALMDNGRLFAMRTGMFGTLPVSATGTNDHSKWLDYQGQIEPLLTCLFDRGKDKCNMTLATNPPYFMSNYSGVVLDSSIIFSANRLLNGKNFLMPSPENYLGKKRLCDNKPAPSRLIFSNTLELQKDGILIGNEAKESCSRGALVQLLLGGYHPDQQTFTHYSANGNGPGGRRKALYLITEIGQEKQHDLMINYLNLPEVYPLSSSASLAMVRMLIDEATGDVDPSSILISNPFKYTWVTSPLNRFGRLDKMGSQEHVAYTPKPVAIHEDDSFVYFFFREADWENTPVPSYNVRRYHHSLTSYSHALYFPWEKNSIRHSYIKQKEGGETFEELYAPDYQGWQHTNDNLRVTGRVARVSKTDAGLPLGLTDASLFDLDHQLSLNAFQTFLKSRLVCRVPVVGVPFVWRLMEDTSKMADNNGACITQVRKAHNLYTKDLHYRAVGRDEFVSVQREVASSVPGVRVPPGVKYYYLSHCKGYKWSYVPKPKTSTALYVEYPELRDIFTVGQKFYGVFSSAFSNEQLHTSSTRADNLKPNVASAICSFSLDDIKATFEGPFKKRDKKTGSYRPHGQEDTISIQPNPHSSDNDRAAEEKAATVKNMTIDFLDPTQPFAEETRHIDLRRHSSRLNFFEEDVYGSRSMWQDVNTQVLLSQAGVVFERVVIQNLADSAILYVATNEGTIYKILTSESVDSSCKLTDRTAYIKWLNNTESMSSIWDNEVYAYLNRTVDKVTFTASFQSDLSMEKEVTFPDDMLLRSDWDCPPSAKTTILSVLTPFGTNKMKIWDMKLVGEGWSSSLVVTTDEKVLQIPTVQCAAYKHCTACTNDPFCSWNVSRCALRKDPEDGVEKADCSCTPVNKTGNAEDDLVLPGLGQSLDLRRVQWYKDGLEIEYRNSRVMLAHDSSLILFNLTPSSVGIYELKNVETGECVNMYEVFLTGCQDDDCRYRLKYQEWCNEYDQFRLEMDKWYNDYEALGFCSNLLK